jgi:hypothetical protein
MPLSPCTAPLAAVFRAGRAFDVSAVRDRDDLALVGNEIDVLISPSSSAKSVRRGVAYFSLMTITRP